MAKNMINLTAKQDTNLVVNGDRSRGMGGLMLPAWRCGTHGQKGRKTRRDVNRKAIAYANY